MIKKMNKIVDEEFSIGSVTSKLKMDLINSLKWTFATQRWYRLAVFRPDKSRSKVLTDKREVFLSSLLIVAITVELAFIGHKVYFEKTENFFQTSSGDEKISSPIPMKVK